MAATANNRVKIHEVAKVTPFSHSNTDFSLSLTYFEVYWLRLSPVDRLYFYEIADLTLDIFNTVVLPNLKHSLSLTLLHYLPLAGNLMWPEDAAKPAVYYFPNDGVSVTVAESDADFNTLSDKRIREVEGFRPFTPQLSISDDKAAVIAIQITLFPNQGFSIGTSIHHAVLDGKSSTMFTKSWAHICKQLLGRKNQENSSLLPDQLTPCFDRTVLKDPEGLDVVYAKHWLDFGNTRSLKLLPRNVNSNMVRGTFELTREDIKKIRDKVKENGVRESKEELHLSSYVVTCAYLYVCLVKAKEEEANTTIILAVTADCRSRLDPPLPVNYVGNCVGGNTMNVKASDFMKETGVTFIAEKISDLVKGLKHEVVKGSVEKIAMLMAIFEKGMEGKYLTVAGSTRFHVYGSDFGWGRPKKVQIVSTVSDGEISLTESGDGRGGVEVGVILEKQQMEAFASLFDHLKHLL